MQARGRMPKIAARGEDAPPLSETLGDVDAQVWAELLDGHPLAGCAAERQPATMAAVGTRPDVG